MLLPTEPIPIPPDGADYRRLARQIRDLARQTRLIVARNIEGDIPGLITGYSANL
jgi:hypothetical protein